MEKNTKKKQINQDRNKSSVQNSKNASVKKNKKEKKQKSKKLKIIKISIISIILIALLGSAIGIGVLWVKFKDELFIDKEDLIISFQNSTVYDKDGNIITTLSSGTKRKCITLSEMGEYLPKAYVAIEDERFYEHTGVDLKRTAAATATYILNRGESSFGGSTITQQLVKNITNDKEDSGLGGIVRKIKEFSKAYQVEQYISKDQILELYLNMIFIGGDDINGVELGANYYFNKEPAELDIAECAFMAGINNSPNSYKPFSEDSEKQEKIKKRTKTVLSKMKELNYISAEQYDEAVAEVDAGLKFEKGDIQTSTEVSYLVEAALDQIVEQVMEEKNMSKSLAETYVYSGGLNIYTTQETRVQETLEKVIVQDKYCTSTTYTDENNEKVTQTSTPTMVITDHKTGYVVAAASATGEKGARTAKTRIGYFNYANSLRKQTGSSMKPIAVIAPGLETGVITAGTVFIDEDTTFENGTYHPKNYYEGFKGAITMRSAIAYSANIPHVKAISCIGLDTAKEFCMKMGLPEFKNEGLSLALGGLSKGVTVTEMAGAYGTIANDGTYIEPTFYTSVTDSDGNIVVEAKQETNEVLSEQNAYIEKSILTSVTSSAEGTATYCKIKGMDTAAKTGTTNNDYDRWLCGFTPYYTATCWYGYDKNAKVSYSGNPAGKIWAEVMQEIHKDLPNAAFVQPEGIVSATICKATGMKATATCTDTYTEIFAEGTVPADCDGEQTLMICQETKLLSSIGCPCGAWNTFGIPPLERNAPWSTAEYNPAPTEYCPHGVNMDWYQQQKAAEEAAQALQRQLEEENAKKQQQSATTNTETTGTGSTGTGSTGTGSTGTGSTGTGSTGTGSTGTGSTGTGSTGTGSTETDSTGTESTGTGSTGTETSKTETTDQTQQQTTPTTPVTNAT